MFKLLANTGVGEAYYSRWGLGFSPDIFVDPSENADSVATNVAQLTFALAGLLSVPTTNTTTTTTITNPITMSNTAMPSSIVDGVVAYDGGAHRGWHCSSTITPGLMPVRLAVVFPVLP